MKQRKPATAGKPTESPRGSPATAPSLGASSELAREINRSIILELIRFRQPLSRVEASRRSGLQPSTVSAIVEQLIQEGWIREGAVVRGTRGRPSTMLSMNQDLVAVAVDLRPDRAIIAIIDLSGRFLSRETVMTVSDPRTSLARIKDRIRSLQELHPDKTFEGVGISVPGRVDPATQRLLLAPNLKWHGVDIKKPLEKSLGLQVELENDANACLIHELWYGRLEGVQDAVLVAVGEGVGAAILAGGQIHAGFNGLAGEFGHIPIDPAGPACACGQRGCWEMFASSQAALRTYAASNPHSKLHSIEQLLRLAEEGDPAAVEAVSRQMQALGRGLRLITAALSPQRILITGEVTACWSRFGHIAREELERTLLAGAAPMLVASGDGELARLSGAAAMMLRRHARYHRPMRRAGAPRR